MKLIGRDPSGAPKMQVLFCQNSAKLSGKRTERGPDSEKPAGAQGATVAIRPLESLRLENVECDSVKASAFQAVAFFVAILLISLDNMRRLVYNKSRMGMKWSFYRENR